jgi:hypothetical protein
LLAFSASNSQASVIDFEDLNGGYNQLPGNFVSGEMTFTANEYTYGGEGQGKDGGFGLNNSTRSINTGWGYDTGGFSFLKTNGSLFDLISIDLSKSWYANENGYGYVLFSGYQANGNVLTKSFENIGNNYSTYIFSNWTNLMEVSVSPNLNGGYFGADNINVSNPSNAVPEPESIALIGLGFLGMAAMRRKKV